MICIATKELDSYVGKTIASLCTNDFSSPNENHCAHFVSHALGLKIGMICGNMKLATRGTGASIRCDELYNGLARKGEWADNPCPAGPVLVFVLSASAVNHGRMSPIPQKHVGILASGKVYHYSNSQKKVVTDPSVESFHEKFKRAYSRYKDVSLYYGVIPT